MSTTATPVEARYEVEDDRASGTLRIRLAGTWTTKVGRDTGEPLLPYFDSMSPGSRIVIEDAGITEWDSFLVAAVRATALAARDRGLDVDMSGLPEGVRDLADLAAAVPRAEAGRPPEDEALTARVGRIALRAADTVSDATEFLGEVVQAFGTLDRKSVV